MPSCASPWRQRSLPSVAVERRATCVSRRDRLPPATLDLETYTAFIYVWAALGTVFQFERAGEPYLAVTGKVIDYQPAAGMGLAELRLQYAGAAWLLEHDPIDLDTVYLGDDSVPGAQDRLERMEDVARHALDAAGEDAFHLSVSRGLFFRGSEVCIALVSDDDSGEAFLVGTGTGIAMRRVGFPEATAERRLALALGEILNEGPLSL